MKNKSIPGKSFNPRILIGIIMLIFVVLVGFFVLPRIAEKPDTTYTVYTLAKDINAGTILTKDDITATSTTDEMLAALTPGTAEEIIGKTAARDLTQGVFVYKSDLISGTLTLKTTVPAGKQIISIPVTSIAMSVSYQLQADDIIRIFTLDDDGKTYVPKTLQYLKIENVYDENGNSARVTGMRPATISLIVNESQAEDLIPIITNQTVHISLMSRNNEDIATTMLEYQEKILKAITTKEEINAQSQTNAQ